MKTFTLNGKQYPQKPLGFGMLCDFEEMGFTVDRMQELPMSFIRAYVAQCMDVDKAEAAKEIDAHFENGGDFDAISNALRDAIEDSGFFRAIEKSKEADSQTGTEGRKKA